MDDRTVEIDGRLFDRLHWATIRMVEHGDIAGGVREWRPDTTPPGHAAWLWLGRATTGEHLFWKPLPAVAAG